MFNGRTNPVKCFSFEELNKIIDINQIHSIGSKWCKGFIDGKVVLVKVSKNKVQNIIREIVVAAQMSTHTNVHKLLGCCLEYKRPILVYEWVENVSLQDRIVGDRIENQEILEWKDRLRILWEISHVIAYLHTAFPRPIIFKYLTPANVFFDKNNAVKVSDFSLSVSIPKGKTYLEDGYLQGTLGYLAPEYMKHFKLSEKVDVYAFGVLFLVLLTGHTPFSTTNVHNSWENLEDWVRECVKGNCISEIIDSRITWNGMTRDECLQHQQRASIELALRCTSIEEDIRPTIVEVATQLKTMIRSASV